MKIKDDLGVSSAWLGNLFLRVIHDTGIVGMIVFAWFLIELGRRAWHVLAHLRRTTRPAQQWVLFPLADSSC